MLPLARQPSLSLSLPLLRRSPSSRLRSALEGSPCGGAVSPPAPVTSTVASPLHCSATASAAAPAGTASTWLLPSSQDASPPSRSFTHWRKGTGQVGGGTGMDGA